MKTSILFIFCLCLSNFSFAGDSFFHHIDNHSYIEELETHDSILIQIGDTEASKFMYESGFEHNGITGNFSSGNNFVSTTKFEEYNCQKITAAMPEERHAKPSYKCSRVISNKNI